MGIRDQGAQQGKVVLHHSGKVLTWGEGETAAASHAGICMEGTLGSGCWGKASGLVRLSTGVGTSRFHCSFSKLSHSVGSLCFTCQAAAAFREPNSNAQGADAWINADSEHELYWSFGRRDMHASPLGPTAAKQFCGSCDVLQCLSCVREEGTSRMLYILPTSSCQPLSELPETLYLEISRGGCSSTGRMPALELFKATRKEFGD